MILTGSAIESSVRNGSITIEPFASSCVNPNSYNYHLGSQIYEIISTTLDPRQESQIKKLRAEDGGSYLLRPHKIYLGSTEEIIGSDTFVTSLIGRSSIGRLGMYLQITADLGQLGAAHNWTLEIEVVSPLRVYPGMPIGQVSFWVAEGERATLYAGGYTDFNQPHPHKRSKNDTNR